MRLTRTRIVEPQLHTRREKKLFIGRMSSFVLVNLPVAAGMLIHGPTSTLASVFWQFINQSVNAACNYTNRSGAEVDWSGLVKSYALACGVSCGLAYSAGKIIERNPGMRRFGIVVPYFAVISASTANMFFSRLDEWTVGVPVAVGSTAITLIGEQRLTNTLMHAGRGWQRPWSFSQGWPRSSCQNCDYSIMDNSNSM